MDKRFILAADAAWVFRILENPKFQAKSWFPLGSNGSWLHRDTEVLLRFRNLSGAVTLDESAKIVVRDDGYYVQSRPLIETCLGLPKTPGHFFVVVEGSPAQARIVVDVDDGRLLAGLENNDPALRLHAYDLPPVTVSVIDTRTVLNAIYVALRQRDPELHSRRTDNFVQSPHILLALLSHVMELRSKEQINFIANLRVIADQFRELLDGRIAKLQKSHRRVWHEWKGRRISFADGGVARVSGLPGSEPMAIRVGVYTVVPGEARPEARETWRLDPYVAADIINAPADTNGGAVEAPNRKRLLEAARYILEALTLLRHIADDPESEVVFLHGPLVNAFETYDEGDPYYIPSMDPSFLEAHGITEEEVRQYVEHLPSGRDGRTMWNHCMAIYGYLMKKIFELRVPVVGVVERSTSNTFLRLLTQQFLDEGKVRPSYVRKLLHRLEQYRITDELLLGCVLDEGEYIQPFPLPKNVVRRARDRWQPVVAQYPTPVSTYLKTSPSSFPFRVEFNRYTPGPEVEPIMNLLYHTARLLPEYAFPVGLDIADKLARVPDWLSRGVSAAIAAQVLARAAATGEPKLLQQVRRLLARSPRDFFFRPGP